MKNNSSLAFFRRAENFVCVTKDKIEERIIEGFAQNIVQLKSSYETNKRKRKRGKMTSTIFTKSSPLGLSVFSYSPGTISRGREAPVTIEFNKKALDKNSSSYQSLCNSVKEDLG